VGTIDNALLELGDLLRLARIALQLKPRGDREKALLPGRALPIWRKGGD
jgi:hypothetical protein